jgi:membrane associated rhomboid family serine protease
MIIPLRTDYRIKRKPWVNYAVIAANLLLYVMGYNSSTPAHLARIQDWMLQPGAPTLEQFFSCMFLHAGVVHLLGNMVFLWVFGNAINDKFGHIGYLTFYLAGGVLAGAGYLLLAGRAPVLGASGAIAAVVGAYLVLLPATTVTLLVWLFWVMWPVEVSSLYFILIQLLFEAFLTLRTSAGLGGGGVAYAAHATGYGFGILVAAGLLAARLLRRDDFDLLHLIQAHRRRLRYRRMVTGGYDPFSPLGSGTQGVRVTMDHAQPSATPLAEELALRRQISEAFAAHDLPTAADLYLELERVAEGPVLPQQQQLDVANQLMASQRYAVAAEAYERFVRQYGQYEFLPDIRLMLGLLYGRYLHQYDLAETCLLQALETLSDPDKRAMAETDLQAVRRRRKLS